MEQLPPYYCLFYEHGQDIEASLEELKCQAANPAVRRDRFPVTPTLQEISSVLLHQVLSVDLRDRGDYIDMDFSHIIDHFGEIALNNIPTYLGQDQIGILLQDNHFITWLKSLGSQFLVLHDEQALLSDAPLSALSYLCALMSETLRNPGVIPLTFFCAFHSESTSVLGGVRGMIRSLLLQLLMAVGDVSILTPLDIYTIAEGILNDNLNILLFLISLVLGCIDVGIVYCFIDGAFWFGEEAINEEMRARSEEMTDALSLLHSLVAQTNTLGRGLVLKVLEKRRSVEEYR
ncbi:hypothetical protein F4818DRAFT_444603 [Hypoxylon cercidicola]|nr:hypothetical protein F4818DRAFT_444603 [Hypoxylon cercidicola]